MFNPAVATAWAAWAVSREVNRQQAGTGQSELPSDPWSEAASNRQNPNQDQVGLEYGMVVDLAAGGHAYRVSLGDRGIIWCSVGGLASFGPYGQRPVDTIPVLSRVWVIRHPETRYIGMIVAVEPPATYNRSEHPSDQFWPFFRSGHQADYAHRAHVENSINLMVAARSSERWIPSPGADPFRPRSDLSVEEPSGGLDFWDFSAGRPLDSTGVGERGFIAETGVGVFADSFHAALRVDEHTGVFAFYPNQLLRLAGHQFQEWTSVSEREEADDEGELYSVKRHWTYPWEAAGLWWWNQATRRYPVPPELARGVPAFPSIDSGGQGVEDFPSEFTQNASGWAARESEVPDVLAAARRYEFGGYLGQIQHDTVVLPPQFRHFAPVAWLFRSKGASYLEDSHVAYLRDMFGLIALPRTHYYFEDDGTILTDDDGAPWEPPGAVFSAHSLRTPVGYQPGVLVEHRTLTGALHLASAKRIFLLKRASLPVPRQRRRPEDPFGDQAHTGYSPSGLRAPPDMAGGANAWVRHAVSDQLAGLFGGRRTAAVADVIAYALNWERLHPFVYHVKDWEVPEEGLAGSPLVNQAMPRYAQLACTQHLADPPSVELDIDHRYRVASYYQTEAAVCLNDDGSVHIYDGYGFELRTGQGHAYLHTPGDLHLSSGRNIVLQAGHDLICRARDSIDLTAAQHDIRLAARVNMQAVAGTSGCGGILLESQAVCPSYAFQERYGEEVGSSGIVLIAPNSQIYGLARDIIWTSLAGDIVLDSGPAGTFRATAGRHQHVIHKSAVQIFPSSVRSRDKKSFQPMVVNEYSAGTTLFGSPVWVNGDMHGPRTLSRPIQTSVSRLDRYGQQIMTEKNAPTEAMLAEFTYRTDEQYRTWDYSLWQPRWMQLAEESNQQLLVWDEPPVTSRIQGFTQLPYPGSAWNASYSLLSSPPYLTQPSRGWVALPRSDPAAISMYEYAGSVMPPPVNRSLSSGWLVVVPPDPSAKSCFDESTPEIDPRFFDGWGWLRRGLEGNMDAQVTVGTWATSESPSTGGG